MKGNCLWLWCDNALNRQKICFIRNFLCFIGRKSFPVANLSRGMYMFIIWENFGTKLFFCLRWGHLNTLRTGDADLRLYITTVQDGWHKSGFLTCAWFPCTIHLITQYMEPVSEWSCWRMFIETWTHSELMICDKYREKRAFYFPLLLCSAFSQHSDFNHDGKR